MNIKAREGYRPNVAMIVINNDNKVLICRRRNTQTWQFPQGGIDPNENIQEAMYRELHEEVGLSKEDVNIIGKSKKTITYDIPITLRSKVLGGKFKGQDQKWFLLKTIKDDLKINLNNEMIPEFEEFEWVSYWRSLDRIIDFKKEAYRQALTELRFFI
ncbi:MAG: RNA pyrophosphohydrolase [Flavobacteriaceae bacterium]|jgi:putative (di)nucleoside polyphosphate hydrolase|nr:RNA pyrophosphohydrolase [Flavobacteriaceae bacterium]|tara:strand:+ start:3386 stop:3859 length:474 start_codon:yes stop_codon:yes gene_type:complete